MRSESLGMGMFPNNVTGSSSESNATITFGDTDARAGVSLVSAIGTRSLAGDSRQIRHSILVSYYYYDFSLSPRRLSETLYSRAA